MKQQIEENLHKKVDIIKKHKNIKPFFRDDRQRFDLCLVIYGACND